MLARENHVELIWKMEKAKTFSDKKCLQHAIARWGQWVRRYKKNQAGRSPYLAACSGALQACWDSVHQPGKT